MRKELTARSKKFGSSFVRLNLTQFLGALNDNLFKLLLIFCLITWQGPAAASRTAAVAGVLFVLPFLLFSLPAGLLADRFGKQRIIVAAKVLELAVMLLGALAFFLKSPIGLYLALFLTAVQSAFFSPAKYGIVPEIVPREELSRANGRLESLTYLAVILGTTLAVIAPSLFGGRYEAAGLLCLVIALAGLFASLGIEKTTPTRTGSRPAATAGDELRRTLRMIRTDGYLALAVVGAAVFMLVGSFVQLNLVPLGIQELGLTQEKSGLLFLLAALGIGAGSLCAGRLSGRNVELGVVPLGALALTAGSLALGLMAHQAGVALAAIGILGFGAGLFVVPVHAFIQFRAPAESRGKVLAAAAFLGWTGVLGASLLTYLVGQTLGLPARHGFIALGLISLLPTVIALAALPDFLLRFVALVLMRLVYRVRVRGGEQVPVEGGALLVANHVSWLDALLLLATQQRRIRFVMERGIYQAPLLRPLFRLMGVIPISSRDSRQEIRASLEKARAALDEGFLVCIFAEGAITRNGTLQEFRPGFERIVRESAHPVIPVHIGGIWGSVFSYAHGPLFSRLPAALPEPVTIEFGERLPSSVRAAQVRQKVMELSCRYFDSRKKPGRTLAVRFVAAARRSWRRWAVADTSGKSLRYGQTLTAALALADETAKETAGQKMVGVLLPPSVGGALANLALTLSGKVPVNLNYTASAAGVRSAVAQGGIRTVLTSRAFLARMEHLSLPGGTLFLEDLLARLTPAARARAWFRARLFPKALLLKNAGRDPDALATVIFSSGSTGEPKGVMLSHHNILSNIEALCSLFRTGPADNICGVLPFFHSFGFTGTLWLPLVSGFSAVYHPHPMEGARIAETVRKHRSTLLLSTPTFLASYLRRAEAGDFASLRLVITGAEKLRTRLADAFESRFGLRPLEGYGATELSPVAAVNLPEVRIGKTAQAGAKAQSVGRPLPGVAVRVVDPETGIPLPAGESGLIQIKGPNVMPGYLGRPDKTAEVLREGWYATGDIGRLDEQGFLHITDRLARFSKIGGEMIPHGAVEEALLKDLNGVRGMVAVTAVPDGKKGERLVVLYTPEAGEPERMLQVLQKSGLPNLWRPGRDCFFEIPAMPLLGTGKLDLQGLKRIALAAAGG